VPEDALRSLVHTTAPGALVGVTALATVGANLVNNLPAVLVDARTVHHMTWGMWAWLLGVNVGAVLLPLGALANLLWLRILRTEALAVTSRGYVLAVAPIAVPALIAAVAVLVGTRIVL
jgi:arsenical pump membrane protein